MERREQRCLRPLVQFQAFDPKSISAIVSFDMQRKRMPWSSGAEGGRANLWGDGERIVRDI